jgi:hypothetical protein
MLVVALTSPHQPPSRVELPRRLCHDSCRSLLPAVVVGRGDCRATAALEIRRTPTQMPLLPPTGGLKHPARAIERALGRRNLGASRESFFLIVHSNRVAYPESSEETVRFAAHQLRVQMDRLQLRRV